MTYREAEPGLIFALLAGFLNSAIAAQAFVRGDGLVAVISLGLSVVGWVGLVKIASDIQ